MRTSASSIKCLYRVRTGLGVNGFFKYSGHPGHLLVPKRGKSVRITQHVAKLLPSAG